MYVWICSIYNHINNFIIIVIQIFFFSEYYDMVNPKFRIVFTCIMRIIIYLSISIYFTYCALCFQLQKHQSIYKAKELFTVGFLFAKNVQIIAFSICWNYTAFIYVVGLPRDNCLLNCCVLRLQIERFGWLINFECFQNRKKFLFIII